MNSTNRVTNRFLVGLTAVILLTIGAAGIVIAVVPEISRIWTEWFDAVSAAVPQWLSGTQIGAIGVSWIPIALIALAAIVVVLLLIMVVRMGRGHTATVVTEEFGRAGRTEIASSVVTQALEESLRAIPEFVSARVSAYRVRKAPVIKIAVRCARGVSPKHAASIVEDRVHALDLLLGTDLPTLLALSGGFRSKTVRETRVQ